MTKTGRGILFVVVVVAGVFFAWCAAATQFASEKRAHHDTLDIARIAGENIGVFLVLLVAIIVAVVIYRLLWVVFVNKEKITLSNLFGE